MKRHPKGSWKTRLGRRGHEPQAGHDIRHFKELGPDPFPEHPRRRGARFFGRLVRTLVRLTVKTGLIVLAAVLLVLAQPLLEDIRLATIKAFRRDIDRLHAWYFGPPPPGVKRISEWVEIPEERPRPVGLEAIIAEASERWGVDPALIKAVIHTESGFNSQAVSPAGAMGLMQLMPETADDLGVTDAFDPQSNVYGGVKLIRILWDTYGSLDKVLIGYNAGPSWVGQNRLPMETRRYLAAVFYLYEQYQKEAEEGQSVKNGLKENTE